MSMQTADSTGQDDDVARTANQMRLERLALKRIVPLVIRFIDAITEGTREWSARERDRCEQSTRGGPGVEQPPVTLLPPDADLFDDYSTVAAINDHFCDQTRRGKRVGPLLDASPLRLIAVADGRRGWLTRAPERVAFPADIPTNQAAMAFGIVCNEAVHMADAPSAENLEDIEAALKAVESDLGVEAAAQRNTAEQTDLVDPGAAVGEQEQVEPPKEEREPAWRRLELKQSDAGGIAVLNGKTFRLPAHRFARLNLLQKAKGMTVTATAIEATGISKPRREFNNLPDTLQAIIDPPGRGSVGYMML